MGNKHWANTWTEIEDLGNGKRSATISVGHRVFFDKADGNKPKRHKLTDERPGKDCVVVQSAKCCVEVHPYYAKYFDVQHEEVRVEEERWVVQRWRDPPGRWQDVGAWNPQIAVEEYAELAGGVVKVTVTYDTDYGSLVVEYFQRDGSALKHNITFNNTSGSTETFRVLQRWAGILAIGYNNVVVVPSDTEAIHLDFRGAGGKTIVTENLQSMVFNPDGSGKTGQRLQRPIRVETHTRGMKVDFIYGNWILAQDESLEIDPDTATLDNPNEDGKLSKSGFGAGGCSGAGLTRNSSDIDITWGGAWIAGPGISSAFRGYTEWDISSLGGVTIDANPVLKYEGTTTNGRSDEINPLTEGAPSAVSDVNLWSYIASGAAYVDPFNPVAAANQSQDLGASAKTDLQTAVTASQSWFAIGFQSPTDECQQTGIFHSIILSEEGSATPAPTLFVEYTLVGWAGGDPLGVAIAGVAKINGVALADITKVNGVA